VSVSDDDEIPRTQSKFLDSASLVFSTELRVKPGQQMIDRIASVSL
jgi:hypothetical protein